MPFFLIWMLLEIIAFAGFVELFGFVNTFFAYLMPGLIGLILLSNLKNYGMAQLQSQWQQGQEPTKEVLNMTAKVIGSLLLIPPTLLTRIIGFTLVLPGIRHLILFVVKTFFIQKMIRSGSAFFGSNTGGFRFYSSTIFPGDRFRGSRSTPQDFETVSEREAQVIDIKPIQVEHKNKSEE